MRTKSHPPSRGERKEGGECWDNRKDGGGAVRGCGLWGTTMPAGLWKAVGYPSAESAGISVGSAWSGIWP